MSVCVCAGRYAGAVTLSTYAYVVVCLSLCMCVCVCVCLGAGMCGDCVCDSLLSYEPNLWLCILTCVCAHAVLCTYLLIYLSEGMNLTVSWHVYVDMNLTVYWCVCVCTYLLIYLSEVFIACIFSTCAYVFPSSFSPYIYYYTYIARLFTATTCKWLAITSASGVSLSCLQTTVVWSFWLFNCSILPKEWGALFTQLCKHAFQVPY